jgi:hypothetical protein
MQRSNGLGFKFLLVSLAEEEDSVCTEKLAITE